jgi:hypothetical protein
MQRQAALSLCVTALASWSANSETHWLPSTCHTSTGCSCVYISRTQRLQCVLGATGQLCMRACNACACIHCERPAVHVGVQCMYMHSVHEPVIENLRVATCSALMHEMRGMLLTKSLAELD